MAKLEFEWNADKAVANLRDHCVAFEQGSLAFSDPFAVEAIDDREAYGEERVVCRKAGCSTSPTPSVASEYGLSRPGERYDMSKTTITARTRPDGTPVRVLDDGREEAFPCVAPRELTAGEVEVAAAADPDARPMTPYEWARARRIPRVKTLRRALGLTQEDFASRYHLPLGTLRDWEQGRSEPDQAAQAYIRAIAGNPEAVQRALDEGPRRD